MENLCISCKRDLGYDNPRQYCAKTHCDYEYEEEEEKINVEVFDYDKKYEDMYSELKLIFTLDFYESAKIEFSDVCSLGDICINTILDDLNDICIKKIENEEKYEDSFYIGNIYDFYKDVYLVGKAPNPFRYD